MYCRSCWVNLPDGTKVCTSCAADQAAQSATPARPAGRGANHSTGSGEPPQKAPTLYLPDEKISGGRSRTFPIIILILLCVAGYYFYSSRHSPHPDEIEEIGNAKPYGEVALRAAPAFIPAYVSSEDIVASTGSLTVDDERDASYVSLVNEATELINAKRYARARDLMEDALFDWPDDPVIIKNLSFSISGLGFKALEDGDLAGARERFMTALSYSRELPAIKGLANTYMKLEEYEEALELILEVREESDYGVDSVLVSLYDHLASAAYRDGDISGALSYVKKALAIAPENDRLNAWFEKISSETKVEEDFRTKEGSHFIVKYESGENAVAGHLISLLLEEAYMRVGYEYGFYPEDSIVAILYTKVQFQDTTRSPSWAGAIYDGRIKMPAGGVTEKTDLLEGVLFHEYTHAIVHRVTKGRRPPVWLNEGFAQYVEGKRTGSRERELKLILGANEISLKNLEGSFMGLDARQAQVAYLLSLSAVEYLLDEFGRSSVIWILEHLAGGESMNDALRNSIYLSYDDFEDGWKNSVMR